MADSLLMVLLLLLQTVLSPGRHSRGLEVRPLRCHLLLLRGGLRRRLLDTASGRVLRAWDSRHCDGSGRGARVEGFAMPDSKAHFSLSSCRAALRAKLFALVHVISARANPVPQIPPLNWWPGGIALRLRSNGFDRLNLTFQSTDSAGTGRLTFRHSQRTQSSLDDPSGAWLSWQTRSPIIKVPGCRGRPGHRMRALLRHRCIS